MVIVCIDVDYVSFIMMLINQSLIYHVIAVILSFHLESSVKVNASFHAVISAIDALRSDYEDWSTAADYAHKFRKALQAKKAVKENAKALKAKLDAAYRAQKRAIKRAIVDAEDAEYQAQSLLRR